MPNKSQQVETADWTQVSILFSSKTPFRCQEEGHFKKSEPVGRGGRRETIVTQLWELEPRGRTGEWHTQQPRKTKCLAGSGETRGTSAESWDAQEREALDTFGSRGDNDGDEGDFGRSHPLRPRPTQHYCLSPNLAEDEKCSGRGEYKRESSALGNTRHSRRQCCHTKKPKRLCVYLMLKSPVVLLAPFPEIFTLRQETRGSFWMESVEWHWDIPNQAT